MSRYASRVQENDDIEHDVSKELFAGIMMLMLTLGIMILNVAKPVWRVHQHDPEIGDVVMVYGERAFGLSADARTVTKPMGEWDFRRTVESLVSQPGSDLHLFLHGGSRERVVRHAAFADSLLSSDQQGLKVRPAVFVHGW